MKKQNGITLISLIITIIIMLILAGVSLSMVMGDGSMLDQANVAATKTKVAEVQEYIDLAVASNKMAKYSKTGLKSKETLATEMVSQGLITEAEKDKMLANEELKINDVVINYGDIETTYTDAVNAGVTEETEGTKLSGTWTFNETIIINESLYHGAEMGGYYIREDVNFTSNGATYSLIGIEWDSSNGCFMAYQKTSGQTDYVNGPASCDLENCSREWAEWTNTAYRTIDFGSTPIDVSQEFYDWFTANATKN